MQRDNRNPSWLAKKSGFTPRTIFRILALEGDPGIETLSKIAEALGVTFAEMITEPDKAEVIAKHAAKVEDHAETRRLMKLQTENDIYQKSLKQMQLDIIEIKKSVAKQIEEKTKDIEEGKIDPSLPSEPVQILGNSLESLMSKAEVLDGKRRLTDAEIEEIHRQLDREKATRVNPDKASKLADQLRELLAMRKK